MPGTVREVEFRAAFGVWRLRTAPPAADLAGAVQEYWEVEGALQPFRETLLPNGAAEVMVNLGPVHEVHSDQGRGVWTDAWVSGIQERALVIESLEGTHLVAARLHPVEAIAVLGDGMARVANRVVPIESVLGELGAGARETLLETRTPAGRFQVLEDLLRAVRDRLGSAVPEFLRQAAAAMDGAHGNIRVSELHRELGVSRRHLSVTFARWTGLSLKRYAAIRRFAWTLAELRGRSEIDWSQLAAEAGYSDQSHLARDFRRVGAATPTEYVRWSTPDGTALIPDER